MADIDILVDSTQVKTAKQDLAELGNSFNSASKSASIFMQAFQRAATQSARDAQFLRDVAKANQEIVNTNLGVTNSYKSAEASAQAMIEGLRQQEAQALKTAKANQELINAQLGVGGPSATSGGAGFSAMEAEINALATRYNSVYAASKLYESELQSLNRANQLGVISTQQYEAQLEQLNVEYQNYANSADGAGLANNRFAQHTNATSRGLNNFGMISQQVGYQVGDFFVQIQSGTSAFVAFGQQATQLAGLIPGIGGAIAGIGISVVTAFLSFQEKAKAAADGTKELDEAIKSLDQSLKNYLTTQEAASLGISTEQLTVNKALAAAQQDILAAEQQIADAKERQLMAGQFATGGLAVQNAATADLAAAEERRAKAQELIAILQQKRTQSFQEELQAMANANAIEEARLRYGEESYTYKRLQREEEVRLFTETQKRKGIDGILLDLLVAQFKVYKDSEDSLQRTKDQAQELKDLLETFNGKEFQVLLRVNYGMTEGTPLYEQNLPEGLLPPLPTPDEITTGGMSGSSAEDTQLQSLITSLQYQRETITAWYEESKALLQSASDQELEVLGGKYEAMARLDEQYRQKIYEAQQVQAQMSFQAYSGMFGALGELLSVFAGKSKGAAIAALAIQKGLAIAQIITSTAAAQMRAYAELGPIAGAAMAAKIGLLGKMQMALVAATGLAQAGQMMSGTTGSSGSGGSSGGGGPKGSASMTPSAPSGTAQTVYISGLDPNALFTGEQLANLFDSFYKENDNRGKVFVVAR